MLRNIDTDNETSSPEEDCHQTPSSAATIIAGNDDLLTQIIVCTPVKSLIRFKSVSKHWFSLISSSHFSLLHTVRRPNRRPSGLFLRKTPSLLCASESEFEFVSFSDSNFSGAPFRSLNFAIDPSGIKILQSCNGLLLCCSFRKEIGKATRNYYIYNPTTKQYSTLPPHSGAESSTVFGVSLAFDPLKSIHYKVICVRSTATSVYYYCIDVYSSETRSWRSCGDPFTTSYDMVLTDGVFWNSSVHWIRPSGASLRFDIDHECLGTMPGIPNSGDWGERRYRYFAESNGHLHLIEIYGTQTSQFDVFEMERDYSKWFVKYRVDLVGIVNAFPEMDRSHLDTRCINYYAYSILSLVREDHEDESALLVHIPGKVLSYNFKDNTFKELHSFAPGKIHKRGSLQFGCFDAYIYVETLASV
ncbi:F-box protein At5g07610-like isoform X1 [Cornus florida]|uniref:F-box protein At5g07610-like isoform X1 n=1 Tax=Cornus florida TaxID=4283 RepID=UPI00289B26B0|nr:F-box protein At5g07610-like isoform X1 [Cornus florida]XP_059636873.1 F-box protein At5g07610-like isoform X1 [Cornus florida]XP_059636874.1 F-box protein At5g07610-like isoform X1 [Cornus florida]